MKFKKRRGPFFVILNVSHFRILSFRFVLPVLGTRNGVYLSGTITCLLI
ncbi:hypothetical protein SLEP1_g39832 [Rubroshorea leprosula]|uniref:Uncharacterized protein n=1 Tax=Rubroshorea leprosula TaxID=152421 RepID=A0AAV5L224_9ROSI|nr:hypothetical protein SLEP1_g39832 [Rubroshorea leprosula]